MLEYTIKTAYAPKNVLHDSGLFYSSRSRKANMTKTKQDKARKFFYEF